MMDVRPTSNKPHSANQWISQQELQHASILLIACSLLNDSGFAEGFNEVLNFTAGIETQPIKRQLEGGPGELKGKQCTKNNNLKTDGRDKGPKHTNDKSSETQMDQQWTERNKNHRALFCLFFLGKD